MSYLTHGFSNICFTGNTEYTFYGFYHLVAPFNIVKLQPKGTLENFSER